MRHRHQPTVAKTAAFAVIHLAIAVLLGWWFTGSFVLGGMLAFIEPTVNTFAAHQVEKRMARTRLEGRRLAWTQGGLLAVSHLLVAIGVGWALTGSWVAAGLYSVAEPLANAVAHHFFSRWWQAREARAAVLPPLLAAPAR
jgi:uncharacterized membrane protein